MKKIIGKTILLGFISAISLWVSAKTLGVAWETPGLQAPESVVYDQRTKLAFVSNVNGSPGAQDGNGFISTMRLDGSIVQLNWVEGLDAPKGLTIVGDVLYVSDINQLVAINIDTGQIIKRYHAPEAKFLNDVVADEGGSVYVSDMVANTIYRLRGDQFSVWVQSEQLENPNGLHIEGDELIVGSWGKMVKGFATETPGHLKVVSLKDSSIASLGNAKPVGNLDGVEADGKGSYYVTDWLNGGLFLIRKSGEATKLLELEQGSADHEVVLKKQLILIPMMTKNKIVAYKIN